MKNLNNILLLILPMLLFGVMGCKSGFFASSKPEETPWDDGKTRAPVALTAKMIGRFPAPSDAEIIPEDQERRRSSRKFESIKLKTAAAVYDVTHFYCAEMVKNGWQSEASNESEKEDARSPHSILRFTNETENARVRIALGADDGAEIEIEVKENLETVLKRGREETRRRLVPMPGCADGSNTITDGKGTTATAVCAEDLSSVAKFYNEELPKAGWQLSGKTGNADSGESVTMTFTKDNRRAIVTLVREDQSSTSVNVRVSK